MANIYKLRTVDGEPAGTFATNLFDWWPGMEFRGPGNREWRIVVIDDEMGVWRVEPVDH